jgi:hypothetical protein
MKKRKPEDLFRRLVDNKISKEELDILLNGMDDEETAAIYEVYLRNHFEKIMDEHALEEKPNKKSYK